MSFSLEVEAVVAEFQYSPVGVAGPRERVVPHSLVEKRREPARSVVSERMETRTFCTPLALHFS